MASQTFGAKFAATLSLDLLGNPILTLGVKVAGFGADTVTVTDTGPAGDTLTQLGDVPGDTFTDSTGGTFTYLGIGDPLLAGLNGVFGQDGSGQFFFFTNTENFLANAVVLVNGVEPGALGDNQWDLVTGGEGAPLCFMPGTLVATPSGQVPVESLAIGDRVLTVDGTAAAVRWMGRQTVSRRFADPMRVLPIRIEAGALGAGLPICDLLVSPDHALLVDGVLIQAGALVNARSIRRECNVPAVFTYYHVELDDHALILAEGVPAETFIDNADRLAFDNWDEHQRLYPEGRAIAEMPLPRAKAHRQVPVATRRRLEPPLPAGGAVAAAA